MNLEQMAERIKFFLENPEPLNEELLDAAAKEFRYYLERQLSPQEKQVGEAVLRPSSLGKCTRMLAYSYHGFEGEPIDYNTRLTFLMGNILEIVLVFAAQQSGVPIEDLQRKVEVEGIEGSLDFILGDYVVDVKSQSDYSFSLGIDDEFGYPTQLEIYRQGAGKSKGGWLTINKNNGKIAVHEYEPKPLKLDIALRKAEIVRQSTPDNLPARDYDLEVDKKTKKMKLCLQCRFCSYRNLCWNIVEEMEGYKGAIHYISTGAKDAA